MNSRKMLITALIFVALYNIFLYRTHPGIGTGLFFAALNIYFFLTRNKESKNILFAVLCSIISIVFASLFSYPASFLVQFVNLVTASFFSGIAFYLYKQPHVVIPSVLSFLLIPIVNIKETFVTLIRQLDRDNLPNKPVKSEYSTYLTRGIIITIPLFGILLLLLVQADPVFAKYTGDFFTTLGERAVISLILFGILLLFGLTKITQQLLEPKLVKQVENGKAVELGIITASVITLFTLFILIQFRYLFSTVVERELHQLGIASLTYSEYVRKGFFELIIAAVISSSVILYVLHVLHHIQDRKKLFIQILTGLLTFETLLLLASAVKRVILYADAHGLTRARVFGFIFLVWLALLLIIFFVRIFRDLKKEYFFTAALTISLMALLSVNILNIDGLIATAYKPTVNNEIDYYYVSGLSSDAYRSWVPIIDHGSSVVSILESKTNITPEDSRNLMWARLALNTLHRRVENLVEKYGSIDEINEWHKNDQGGWIQKLRETKKETDIPERLRDSRKWQSRNITEYNAYVYIRQNFHTFTELLSLENKLFEIDKRVMDTIRIQTPIDRSTRPPLMR